MSKMQLPFKSMKVTFGLDPNDLPRRDTTGQKSVEMVFFIPNTTIRLTASINPKTYRKVLKTLDDNPDNVILAIQGKISEQWQRLEEAGLIAQIKVSREKEFSPASKITTQTEQSSKNKLPIIIIKKKLINTY